MPNHIINRVHVREAREADMKKIKLVMKTKESEFDFNALAPMPKELKHVTSPVRIITEKEYKKQIDEMPSEAEIDKSYWGHGLTLGMSKRYKKLFGADNWYDWHVMNWGTKWNAYDIDWQGNVIEFQTAWSTPEPIIHKLSKRFPEFEIYVEYADEDIGSNCGTYSYKGGELLEEETEGEEFACELWGNDYEEWKKERDGDNDEEIATLV